MEAIYSRKVGYIIYGGIAQPIMLIMSTLRTGLGLWLGVLTVIKYKKGQIGKWKLIFVFGILLFLVSPLALPRFFSATLLVSSLLLFSKRLNKGCLFIIVFVIGLLYAFPMLSIFRSVTSENIGNINLIGTVSDLTENFLGPDYDAFSTLTYSVRYVNDVGISGGKQVLGAALFFIPNSIWEGKSGGGGPTMIQYYDPSAFNNVSCPLMGELYIDFGLPGVFVCALLFGMFLSKLDNFYWRADKGSNVTFGDTFYPTMIPYLFFFMRGALNSVYSYYTGLFFMLCFILITLTIFLPHRLLIANKRKLNT